MATKTAAARRTTADQLFFAFGAVGALLGVGAGAFAAHGLKGSITTDNLNVFQIGVQYQMYAALALLATAWAATRWPGTAVTWAGWLLAVGAVLFSGSLYVLALTSITWIGVVTPLGGLCFLGGFGALAAAALRGR